jgi:CHAT domain-containing protein
LSGKAIPACLSPQRGRGLALNQSAGAVASSDALKYLSIDFANICYTPLKGTAEEAKLINAVVPKATVLTERQATEAALKQLNGPAVLHVATHGFFLPDEAKGANANMFGPAPVVTGENPLLRSGLIMAGANQRASGAGEDGVLTAAEVAGLSLWGTKLVVLSACETGLGDVVNGAGVYGLRRALVLAGSETQVMSLWQVDDDATRDLMSDYYARLEKGQGRSEAMRSAQLAMLRADLKESRKQSRSTQAHTHPYYWAPFISSGDWRTLDGKDR